MRQWLSCDPPTKTRVAVLHISGMSSLHFTDSIRSSIEEQIRKEVKEDARKWLLVCPIRNTSWRKAGDLRVIIGVATKVMDECGQWIDTRVLQDATAIQSILHQIDSEEKATALLRCAINQACVPEVDDLDPGCVPVKEVACTH